MSLPKCSEGDVDEVKKVAMRGTWLGVSDCVRICGHDNMEMVYLCCFMLGVQQKIFCPCKACFESFGPPYPMRGDTSEHLY